MPESRTFHNPGPLDREEATTALNSDDPALICNALVAVALNDDDAGWVEEQCWRLGSHPDADVRGIAGLCLGHVARRFGGVQRRSWRLVKALCRDPEVGMGACDGLADLRMFASPWRRALRPASGFLWRWHQ